MTRRLRQNLVRTGAGKRKSFRWRGGEVSRIEGFTDAVFAFAVTLLVVSLEVPRTTARSPAASRRLRKIEAAAARPASAG